MSYFVRHIPGIFVCKSWNKLLTGWKVKSTASRNQLVVW